MNKRKILALLNNSEELICFGLMLLICLLVLAQIFFRYVLNNSLVWSEELSRYSFVWMTFIGTSFIVKRKSHISISFIYNFIPNKIKPIVNIISYCIIILFFSYLVFYGLKVSIFMYKIGSSAMNIPMFFIYVSIPIGFLLSIYRMIQNTIFELYKIFKN